MTLSSVKNRGYWSVQNQEFDNKVKAVLFAQQQGLDMTDINYHYNDTWWDQHDWSVEPQESIDELYVRRARQLREKYKTVILRYSGGADSHNILQTFVANDIKIDVISVNVWSLGDPDNTILANNVEKKIRALPILQELQANGVEFQVIVSDQSELLSMIGDDPTWFLKFDTPGFKLIDLIAHRSCTTAEYKQFDSEDTCVILGVDKPQIKVRHDRIWYFEIIDTHHTMHNQNESKMVHEPFYWTADMPEIPIKQSHEIKNFYRNHLHRLPTADDPSLRYLAWSKTLLIPVIYPRWFGDLDPFAENLPYYDPTAVGQEWREQNGKSKRGPWANYPYTQLLHLSPYFDTWLRGIELADSMIDSRFKHDGPIITNGLIDIGSKQRWLGR